MLIRHRSALMHQRDRRNADPWEALLAVVGPTPALLAASLAAVDEAELANENGTYGFWQTGEVAA
jgi:hypothetical protein